jgi:hypothetical protein
MLTRLGLASILASVVTIAAPQLGAGLGMPLVYVGSVSAIATGVGAGILATRIVWAAPRDIKGWLWLLLSLTVVVTWLAFWRGTLSRNAG